MTTADTALPAEAPPRRRRTLRHPVHGVVVRPLRAEQVIPLPALADPMVDRAAIQEALDQHERLGRPVPREPEPPLARRSKLAALFVALALLAGSIATAAALPDHSPSQPPPARVLHWQRAEPPGGSARATQCMPPACAQSERLA
jgi:hypothetical protein